MLKYNPDLTNYGQNAYLWIGRGCVGGSEPGCQWVLAGRQISKNRFFHFSLQNPKIDYILAARRVNPPRPSVYFWTFFCPELVKLMLYSKSLKNIFSILSNKNCSKA
jgi:hypothetical protein